MFRSTIPAFLLIALIATSLTSNMLLADEYILSAWRTAIEATRTRSGGVLPAEDAAGAVNGVVEPEYAFHTLEDASPWWQVDLEETQRLDRVIVRTPHFTERMNGYQVKLSDDGVSWNVAYTETEDLQGVKLLTIPLDGAEARFVRLQVPTKSWMHLSEVEVYAKDSPEENIALWKPADQSSASGWSSRSITLDADGDWSKDFETGMRVISQAASTAGPNAESLLARASTLRGAGVPLGDSQWIALYDDALSLQAEWRDVAAQWRLIDPVALVRAVDDLTLHFPERYPDREGLLRRASEYAERYEAINEGIAKGDAEAWRAVTEIVAFQRETLLANPLLDIDRLLVLRRRLGTNARSAMGSSLGVGTLNAHTNDSLARNGWDNEIAILSGLNPASSPDSAIDPLTKPSIETLYKPVGDSGKIITDLDVDFEAHRVMFSSVGDAEPNWRLFELNIDGTELSQVVPDDGPDVGHFDSCYLPDDNIMFCSTASYQGLPCEYGSRAMVCLYRYERASGRIRQLTFEQDSDWCPTALSNGRVMYLRWEYADLPHSNSRILFHMNPDGTSQMEYYGSGSYFTPSFFYARPIPDHSSQVIGIVTGHHGTPRSGRLMIIDPALGRREAEGVVQEIPGWGETVEPIVADRIVDGVWPQFIHPYPLSEKYHIVAMKPDAGSLWGIYLVDLFDNRTLIYQEEGTALLDPILLQPKERPPVLPDRVDLAQDEATVFLSDIYSGPGLAGIPRGTVKRLRVGAYYFSSRGTGGLLGSIGIDGPWDIKRVLGTVPVDADGSATFKIPANTPIFLQPLDEEGKALQLMRSWLVGMPGEVVSCVGCHESQNTIVAARPSTASFRLPDVITPWEGHGPVHGFHFPADVQPVLDRYCIECHDGETAGADNTPICDLRGDEYITDWSSQIAGNCSPARGGNFSVAYANLHRFVRRPGIESDLHMLTPGEYHADTTELVQMLRDGRHNGVHLDAYSRDALVTWIDLNAPFHGSWSTVAPGAKAQVEGLNDRRIELADLYASIRVDYEEEAPNAFAKFMRAAELESLPPAAELEYPSNRFKGQPVENRRESQTIVLGDDIQLTLSHMPAYAFTHGERTVNVPSFWMATTETTNAQFQLFDPSHDSRHESRHAYQFGRLGYPMNDPEKPVLRVSWNEANAFCEWLSEKTGRRFTLPTEIQWEYACRSGSETPFWFGDEDADYAPYANLGDIRLQEFAADTAAGGYTTVRLVENPNQYDDWVPRDTRFDDGTFLTSVAGTYAPNPWGLYDMHGNVAEWTRTGLSDGRKIAAGGSWYDRPHRCTADARVDYQPYHKVFNVGFRVICEE
jgi:formylglycine-generating enzyme required for sulfatase activity